MGPNTGPYDFLENLIHIDSRIDRQIQNLLEGKSRFLKLKVVLRTQSTKKSSKDTETKN